MLENIFYNNSVKTWLISLIIIIGTAILCKIFSWIYRITIKRITKKTKNQYDDIIFEKIETPILIFLMLLAFWISFKRMTFPVSIEINVVKAFTILLGLNITWTFTRLCIGVFIEASKKMSKKNHDFTRLVPIIKRTSTILIWLIGIVMTLNNIGVNIGALLGALGIGGIATALAAQDTVKNIIGGITLITDHPFKIGDRIMFDKIDGYVEDIGLRSTKIRTLNKRTITIPNSKIVDSAIENVTTEHAHRIVLNLGLTYDTTPDKLKKALEILRETHKNVNHIDEKGISATFDNYGASALSITFIYFIKKSSPDWMESISEVNFYILENFNSEKLEFAFPTQTVILEKIN
ncbi:MAG: mechanosensitive ion channel family protein [Bacteroidales bacterium]|jgi:MscS family membrane protein|nr:mechanosensitive ion channel family protein [Bacteroidales bacterium]